MVEEIEVKRRGKIRRAKFDDYLKKEWLLWFVMYAKSENELRS